MVHRDRRLPTDITGGHDADLTTIWFAGAKLAEAFRQRGREMLTGQVPDFVTAEYARSD